jgi:hypothetical protein
MLRIRRDRARCDNTERPFRGLQLKAEAIRRLTSEELHLVAGACDLGSLITHIPPGGGGANCVTQ